MSRDAEDEDHTTLLRLNRGPEPASTDPVLSQAAFTLHTAGIMNSIEDGRPGFIFDDYLNAIAAETTVTAAELYAAGFWERATDGYQVLDTEMLDMALNAQRRVQQINEDCTHSGEHVADEDASG